MSIDVAVVGLGFGGAFAPLYARHPDVGRVAVVDTDPALLAAYADRFGFADRFTSLAELLADDSWDAVHLTTPVPLHAEQSLAVLRSGRHCACAVPMALTVADCAAVLEAAESAGVRYMMMETSVYAREFLLAHELHAAGGLGELTFFRGVHVQNLDGFPRYWMGYPPMAYLTHALSPALALAGARVESVTALGSGHLAADQRTGGYDNRWPLETGLFRLDRDDLAAEVTMSFFATARSYQEGFSVYGTRAGLEWPAAEGEPLLGFRLLDPVPGRRGRGVEATRVSPRDRPDLLPPGLAPFTGPVRLPAADGGEPVDVLPHHGGSHPHLVHEFVSSVVEHRSARIDAATAADWTVPGLCAHESAMAGGRLVRVPRLS